MHRARQVDAIVEAHGDRRVLRHANERTGHLPVEAVHRERVALDGATDEHRGEVERVAVRETRDLRRLRRRKLLQIDAFAGEKGRHRRREPDETGDHRHAPRHRHRHRHAHRHRVARRGGSRRRRPRASTNPPSCPASNPFPAWLASWSALSAAWAASDTTPWLRRSRRRFRRGATVQRASRRNPSEEWMREERLQPSTRGSAMQDGRSGVRRRRRDRLGGDHEQELVQFRVAHGVLAVRDFAEAVPLFEIRRHRPRDIGAVCAERRRRRETRASIWTS